MRQQSFDWFGQFNLFTIVKCIIMDYITKQKSFCTFDICQDVINLHFQNRVGYIPLISTLHEKFHNGFLSVPIDLCYGNFRYILQNYAIEEDDMNIIAVSLTIKSCDLKEQWIRNYYPGVVNG